MRKPMAIVSGLSALLLVLPGAGYDDPPARVARPSYIAGETSIRHGSEGEWLPFVINYPATTGDEIWTDDHARTELHVGSSALRLGERTDLVVEMLEDDRAVFDVNQGDVQLRLRALDRDDSWRIVTPTSALTITRRGLYRVSVDPRDNSTTLIVRDGEVSVDAASGTFYVEAGQAVVVHGDPNPSYDLRRAPREDAFDAWAADRDRQEDRSESAQYVSREMTGYEALDGYGQWVQSPEYGWIWAPTRVASGWAPYRYGRWVWVNPWGWTWIDEQPWGFAPFHYGRWARYRGGWVWVPGARVVRPVYAPALVAFVGGGGWSATVRFGGSGGVAWFPLAPGEPWIPEYHVTDRYVKKANAASGHSSWVDVGTMDVTKIHYRNLREADAVTAVSHDAFVSSRPVQKAVVPVTPREFEHVDVVAHAAPVVPERASRVPENGAARQPAPRTTPPLPYLPRVPQQSTQPFFTAQSAAVSQRRAIDEKQLVEHTQLEDKHQQERTAPPSGTTPSDMHSRQAAEHQEMERRHTAELAAEPPAPPKYVKPKEPAKPKESAKPKETGKSKETGKPKAGEKPRT